MLGTELPGGLWGTELPAWVQLGGRCVPLLFGTLVAMARVHAWRGRCICPRVSGGELEGGAIQGNGSGVLNISAAANQLSTLKAQSSRID